MKKIIVAVILIFVSNMSFAQSAFDKYDGRDDVTSIAVNKKMFQMMGSVKIDANDIETQHYLQLIKKLENLQVFTTLSAKISSDMKATAETYRNSRNLNEMMRINDKVTNLKIWVRSGTSKNQIEELLMFSEQSNNENQSVLMSLTGNFNFEDIEILMNKMKIPGVEELKKTSKTK